MRKIQSIQVLRAVAVLLVIFYHFDISFKNGYVGVDVFFVISGFVISRSLLNQEFISVRSTIWRFYQRRISRLFPAFFLVFVVTSLLVFAFYSPNEGKQQSAIKAGVGAALAVANFILPRVSGGYFSLDAQSNPFLHTWSLSVEEQFYVIYPFIFLLLLVYPVIKNRARVRNLLLAALVIASLSTIIEGSPLERLGSIATTPYFSPVTRAWEFLAGCWLALSFRKKDNFPHVNPKLLQSIAIVVIASFCAFPKVLSENSLQLIVIPVLASIVFLWSSFFESEEIVGHTSWLRRVFAHLGDLSYSLYLWHWPIWVSLKTIWPGSSAVSTFAALGLTYVSALLTYKFVESRFIGSRSVRPKTLISLVSAALVVEFIIALTMIQGVQRGWGEDWTLNSHAVVARGCDSGDLSQENCRWTVPDPKGSAVLVGDSMSWAIADGLIEATSRLSLDTRVMTLNGCSMSEVKSNFEDGCSNWRRSVIDQILAQPPKVVILANSNGYSKEVLAGYGQFINTLQSHGIRVLFIRTPPGGDDFSARRALLFRPGAETRSKEPPAQLPLSTFGIESASEKDLAVFDPAQILCNPKCAIAIDGSDVYTYGEHLSVYGSKLLTPRLQQALSDLLNS